MVAADLNNDGRVDLTVAHADGISIYWGGLAPVLSVTSTHTGSFSVGQTDASYTLVVSNTGPGDIAAPVAVTDTLPSGLTASAIAGDGWNCNLAGLRCTRLSALAAGVSYPPIAITIAVGADITPTVENRVSATGTGAISGAATDSTTVVAPPVTIQTSPNGLQFRVDGGSPQNAPQTLTLTPGSHTVQVDTTQAGSEGTQYVFHQLERRWRRDAHDSPGIRGDDCRVVQDPVPADYSRDPCRWRVGASPRPARISTPVRAST